MLSVMRWEKFKDCTWMTTKMRQARINLWPSLTWSHSALISRWCRSAQRVHQLTPEDSVVEHGWIVLQADWLPAYEANGCECFEVWITEANCLFHMFMFMFMSNFILMFLMCITFTHTHTPFIRLKHFIVSNADMLPSYKIGANSFQTKKDKSGPNICRGRKVRHGDQPWYPHVLWPLRWTIAHNTFPWMVPVPLLWNGNWKQRIGQELACKNPQVDVAICPNMRQINPSRSTTKA